MNINNHQHRHAWDVAVQIRRQKTFCFSCRRTEMRSKGLRCEFLNIRCISCCNKRNIFAVCVWGLRAGWIFMFNDSFLIFAIVSATALLLWYLHGNSLKLPCCSTWLQSFFCIKRHANVEHPPTPVRRVTLFLILELALLQLNDVDRRANATVFMIG